MQSETKLIRSLNEIAGISYEASSVQEAMRILLEKVCIHSGFSVGHIYLTDSGGTLVSSNIHYFEYPSDYEIFKNPPNASTYVAGIGLPYRVFESGEPEWISDVTQDPYLNKATIWKEIEVKSGLIFPALEHKKVVAVLELYSKEVLDQNDSLLTKISIFASQLGRITERERLEEQLRLARKSTKDAKTAKSNFLSNMSHEIRTPMNGISGMAELLLFTNLTKEQYEYVEIIRDSTNDLLTIVNDILDFSKVETKKLKIRNFKFDLYILLASTINPYSVKMKEKGLVYSYHIDPKVPSSLIGDPGRLRQIMNNFISNAIKFTKEGEIAINVTLDEETDSHATVRFAIRDTGIGIPSNKIEGLFKPFSQVDASTTREYGGIGLGLAISKHIIEAMGGHVGLESEEGSGSTVWFRIVLEKQTSNQQQYQFELGSLDGLRVLVVDSNDTNRQIIVAYLESWSCRVEEASSAEEAMVKLCSAVDKDDLIKIALIDYYTSAAGGNQFCNNIKAEFKLQDLRPVILNSVGMRGEAEYFRELGFAAYLNKPVKQNQLFECLRMIAGNSTNVGTDSTRQIITQYSLSEDHKRRVRVLVVDDCIVNQKMTLGVLEKKLGYDADVVNNGREAVKSLERLNYDIVLMDCQMPEMDGYEATRIIRDKKSSVMNHRIPIIAMTADVIKGNREKCLKVGMDDYISKPINIQVFTNVIKQYIQNDME